MMRHIPGLYASESANKRILEGLFLVRVERAFFRWHPNKPFLELWFAVEEPKASENATFIGRLYCTEKALWKFNWFLRDFGYDSELLRQDHVDVKAILHLRGVVRVSHSAVSGRSYQNLEAFASAGEWQDLSGATANGTEEAKGQE